MKRVAILLYWLPAVCWMLAIYYFTTIPYSDVPRPVQDKLLHAIVYFILALFIFIAFRRTVRCSFSRSSWVILAWCLIYAFLIQWNENHIATRAGEFDDWLADAGGSATLLLLLLLLKHTGSRSKRIYYLLAGIRSTHR